jgi:hypothetical protein
MLRRQKYVVAGFALAALLAAGIGTAIARESISPRLDSVTLGQEEIQRLLPLMDRDKNGTVSKQEFTAYMDAEFARLEKNKNGDALLESTSQPEVRPINFTSTGK